MGQKPLAEGDDLYAYKGIDQQGAVVKGQFSANTEREARTWLRLHGIHATDLKEVPPGVMAWLRLHGIGLRPKLGAADLSAFMRQMRVLLKASLPYDAALGMLIRESSSPLLRTALGEVQAQVQSGVYLADAMATQSQCFPPLMVNMMRAGEVSASLERVMERLANHYERQHRLETKLLSAAAYPLFMTCFGFAVTMFLVLFVIPRISRLFDQFNAQLPLPTRMLIAISEALVNWWWLMIILLTLAWVFSLRWFRSHKGQLFWARWELQLPLWGKLRHQLLVHRFANTLAALLASGVELRQALHVAGQVMDNHLFRQALQAVILQVQNHGVTLASALRKALFFGEDVCQMVSIGEETGDLEVMLTHIAERYEQQTTSRIDALSALMEPVLILLMGLVVGFIVLSVLLPLLQLNQLVR